MPVKSTLEPEDDCEWVYERVELGERNFMEGHSSTTTNDRSHHTLSMGVLECRNLSDGKIIWRKQNMASQYSTSGFIIVGNKVIFMDDVKRELVVYDLVSGNMLWAESSSVNNSYLRELNGVVYYGSRGDGK
jgi:outer membrane protein assembly factor BamB